MTEKKVIQLKEDSMVLPVVNPQQAAAQMAAYQELCLAILDTSDFQKIQNKDFKKKSAWRKLGVAFNLSTRIVAERDEYLYDNEGRKVDRVFHFTVEATAPNGRVTTGTGSCNSKEKGSANCIHNVRATAETRATNRAISNMVGFGEVSAEEVDQDKVED